MLENGFSSCAEKLTHARDGTMTLPFLSLFVFFRLTKTDSDNTDNNIYIYKSIAAAEI